MKDTRENKEAARLGRRPLQEQTGPGPKSKEARRPVWAEVSLGALAFNLEAIRKYVNPP